jgi:hypothetical protein
MSMIHVLEGQDFSDAGEFVHQLNKARLANKQKWIVYIGTVQGQSVELKSFDHGDLQILRVAGRDARREAYGMNVGAWKDQIAQAIQRAAKAAA